MLYGKKKRRDEPHLLLSNAGKNHAARTSSTNNNIAILSADNPDSTIKLSYHRTSWSIPVTHARLKDNSIPRAMALLNNQRAAA